jgi:hypothetical protein
MAYYGTVNEANTFFSTRLWTYDWDNASVADRAKALQHATDLIDQFDYVGQKYAVAILYGTSTAPLTPTDAEIRAAELSQPLQFPRGEDADASSTIPTEVEQACYLIAKALMTRDPEADLEALATKKSQYAKPASMEPTQAILATTQHVQREANILTRIPRVCPYCLGRNNRRVTS